MADLRQDLRIPQPLLLNLSNLALGELQLQVLSYYVLVLQNVLV